MKSFIEEYGLAILAVVVTAVLIALSTPIGGTIKETLNNIIDAKAEKLDNNNNSIYLYAGDGLFSNGESFLELELDEDKKLAELPEEPTLDGFKFSGWWTTNAITGGSKLAVDTILENRSNYYARWIADRDKVYAEFSGYGMSGGHLYIDNKDLGSLKKGDKVIWHDLSWTVLAINGNDAFILCDKIFDSNFNLDKYSTDLQFSDSVHSRVFKYQKDNKDYVVFNSYDNSFIDDKLENYFYKNILGSDSAIIATNISIGYHEYEDGYTYLQSLVNRHVFALSYTEAKYYLDNNNARIGSSALGNYNWWTRTGDTEISDINGTIQINGTKAFYVNDFGEFISANISDRAGIRPALHLNLSKLHKNGENYDIEIIKE